MRAAVESTATTRSAERDSESQYGPALSVDELRVRYGDVEAVKGISFAVEQGEFVTLLGPSGCGKTTTLRCIAGLEDVWAGSITIGDRVVASERHQVPPQARNINMVFQSYAVWPHLSVASNVGYGLKGRSLSKTEIRERTREALEMVGLETFADRYGTELSGGQQQRVALARAVVTQPEILLFDEPLSNLDAGLRERMRDELLQLHRRIGRTAVYVTHDQSEAMAMSDRVILMNDGRIEQLGPPRALYGGPKTRFAAEFIGTTNILEGAIHPDGSGASFTVDGLSAGLAIDVASGVRPGSHAVACRPEKILIGDAASRHPVNVLRGSVESVAFLGSTCDVQVHVEGLVFRVAAPPSFDEDRGSEVDIAIPPSAMLPLQS